MRTTIISERGGLLWKRLSRRDVALLSLFVFLSSLADSWCSVISTGLVCVVSIAYDYDYHVLLCIFTFSSLPLGS